MIKTSIKRVDPAKYEIKSFDPGAKKMTQPHDANLKMNFRWPFVLYYQNQENPFVNNYINTMVYNNISLY